MISYSDMLSRVESLQLMYDEETDGIRAQMIAKLSALEIGGWLEEFFDLSLIQYIKKKNPDCLAEIKSEIEKVYNFTYRDLRKIMMKIIGIGKLYDIEKSSSRQIELLNSSIGKLKSERDKAAHTSVSVSTTLASPSVLKREFISAYENSQYIFDLLLL